MCAFVSVRKFFSNYYKYLFCSFLSSIPIPFTPFAIISQFLDILFHFAYSLSSFQELAMTYLQAHLFFPWLCLIYWQVHQKQSQFDYNFSSISCYSFHLSAYIINLLVQIIYILQQCLNILVIVILNLYLVIPKYVSYVNLVLIFVLSLQIVLIGFLMIFLLQAGDDMMYVVIGTLKYSYQLLAPIYLFQVNWSWL